MARLVKFSEMPYHRPDLTEAEERVTRITRKLVDAADYEEAREAFLMMEAEHKRITTQANLALIRHSIDTRVEFYDKEMTFWNGARPRLRATVQKFDRALLESPFRAKLEEEFGAVAFLNIELEDRSFSPELIPDMKEVNDLSQEYMKIIASAQIPFEGGVYTLSQLTPFKKDRDDARRLAAWKAEGKCKEFINYRELEKWKDFGGIRIDDFVLVTKTGCRVLGKPIPKTVKEIEETMAS